jgi:hypothetical protein
MATIAEPALRTRPRPQILTRVVEREARGWTSWVMTTDHKRIGIMYLMTVLAFFVLGGVEAMLMRAQLAVPDNTLITPEHYNQLLTMHGTTMIFLVIVPVWAGFANYLIPLMIGARDVAFPRLNAWSYWMYLFGGLALYVSVFFSRRRPAGSPMCRSRSGSTRPPTARRRGSTWFISPAYRRSSARSISSPRFIICARPEWVGAACRCSSGRF